MTLLLVVCIFVGTAFCDWSFNASIAFADSDDIQTRYEQTNVMNNLKGSTIGGKAFDIKDYPHNANAKPQIISFVEFCYSYYAEKQDDYGLYIYVYNPQDIAIDTNTQRNKIQLTYGNKPSYNKYMLTFLNYSNEAGLEGRFYKFKINLTDAERKDILNTVSPDERIYKVSGIELSVKGKVIEHGTAQTYTYKGFAIGYGSELAETDTLSCKVDGFDKYISLDVRSTYWRPKGTHSDGFTRDTLHSVYFSVPNKIIDEYGEMTGVHATWLNAYTAPILVTGNKTIYNAVQKQLGKYVHGGTQEQMNANTDLAYALIATMAAEGLRDDVDMAPFGGYYAYNQYVGMKSGQTNYLGSYDKIVYYLNYLFYAENGNADTFTLPAEALIGDDNSDGWFKTYTDKFGGEKVNDRYSKALFDEVDERLTDVKITSNDEYTLTDKTVSDTVWNRLFGSTVKHETSYTLSAIQKVTTTDVNYNSDKSAFCDNFYIAESDYDEFKQYVIESNAKNETVYLFRYYQSEYRANEVTEYRRTTKWYLGSGDLGVYEYVDTNAYFAQMWVQLDFDIIDLTFTKDNVVTVIPVVMSPMDIAADVEHPVSTQPEKTGTAWWRILLAILLVILVIILLLKFAPGVILVIGKVLLFVITLPFKLIGATFKPIHNKAKAAREKRKLEREANRDRRRIEREQRKQAERQRKVDEKQKRREDKIKHKEAEKQRRREQKQTKKEKKREEKHDKKMRKQAERNYKDFEKYDEFPWCEERPTRKKKYSLAELDKMSDAELAEMYFETYGFDDADIPDDLFD